MPKKYRDVRRILRKNGWWKIRTTGSHEIWWTTDGRQTVVAGKDGNDVAVGTLKSIRQQTGIEELR